jgi:hypothetical protein
MVLFLLPGSLLVTAWRRSARRASEGTFQSCRMSCGTAALVIASCATLLELAFFFSWFHNGGSPHGMTPSPGAWKVLGRLAFWTALLSIVLVAFGKGRWRLMFLAWAVALPLVASAIFMLEMD